MTKGSKCETCGNPDGEEHEQFKHPFNDGSVPVQATFGRRRSDGSRGPAPAAQRDAQGPQSTPFPPMPFDPVLRQALINKGVLTPGDLREAEDQIRAVTAAFHQEQEKSND